MTTPVDAIVARLTALHPKRIDLSLDRVQRLLAALDHPGAQAAAGDPCRRHQRQGLHHRLPARDPGSRRQARACLYLAASGALQRALPAGCVRRGAARLRCGACRHAGRMRARQCRRADHRVRDHHRGRPAAVRAPSGRRAADGSRPRRAARRHQCGGQSARHHRHAHFSIDHTDFLGDTLEKIAAEKAGILKRGAPAIVAAQQAATRSP